MLPINGFFFKRAISVFLVVVFLGFGVGYLYHIYQNYVAKNAAFERNELIKMGDTAHEKGNISEAITYYEKALVEPSYINTVSMVNIKSQLATDLYARNKGDDRIRAVNLFKGIILDTSLEAPLRATALNDFLALFNRSYNLKFAKNYIFTGELFGSFMKEDGDVLHAVAEAYKYGYSLYPSPAAAFRVAHSYGAVLRQQPSLDAREKEQLLENLKEWTQKGELALSQFESDNRAKVALMYQLDGVAREIIGEFSLPETAEIQYKFSEDSFKRALVLLSPEATLDTYRTGLYVRYYYALMLARRYGEERKLDIRGLLDPIISLDNPFQKNQGAFLSFFRNMREINCQKDIPLLASFSPEFYEYLVANKAGCP